MVRNRLLALVISLGLIRFAQGDPVVFPEFKPETARDYLRAVAGAIPAQNSLDPEVCLILARLRSQLGEKAEAEKLARQALERQPDQVEMIAFFAGILIQQDRMKEAVEYLRQAVRLRPKAAREHRQLGMVLDRLGDRIGAQSAFDTAIRLNPNDATARLLLGRLLLDQGQVSEAAVQLDKACQLDPKLAGAHYALSQALNRLGQPEAARESLKAYQDLRQKEKEALDSQNAALDNEKGLRLLAAGFHTELAGHYLQRQMVPLAEQHLHQAVYIAPQEPRGYEMLSAIYLQSGRLPEARGVCQELVRLWPGRAAYRANLGTVLLQLKEPAAAVEQWKQGLALDPKDPLALANLARFYLNTRQNLPTALALCQRLIECAPAAAHYDLLGWALYANGQTNAARQAAAQAVERDPNNAVYRERYQKLQRAP